MHPFKKFFGNLLIKVLGYLIIWENCVKDKFASIRCSYIRTFLLFNTDKLSITKLTSKTPLISDNVVKRKKCII